MLKFRKITAVIIGSALLVTGIIAYSSKSIVGSNQTSKNKVVRIGYPGKEALISGLVGIAQDKKIIDDELAKVGYTVQYVPFAAAGPAVNEALASKQIDLAFYADFPGVVLQSKGADTKLLGVVEDNFNSTIVVKSDSKIASINDLKGKKIGFTKGTYMQKYLLEVLKASGLSDKDVELINITTEGESALIAGNIDAFVATDDNALQLTVTKKVAKEIDSTRNHPELSAQFIFVGVGSYVTENPEAVVAVEKSLLSAKNYFQTNKEDSFNILTKSGLDLEAVKVLYNKQDNFPIEITADSIERLELAQQFLLNQKLITNSFDVNVWADNSYYQKALSN